MPCSLQQKKMRIFDSSLPCVTLLNPSYPLCPHVTLREIRDGIKALLLRRFGKLKFTLLASCGRCNPIQSWIVAAAIHELPQSTRSLMFAWIASHGLRQSQIWRIAAQALRPYIYVMAAMCEPQSASWTTVLVDCGNSHIAAAPQNAMMHCN